MGDQNHEYISDNKLYLSKNKQKDFDTIIYYIYERFILDYDAMEKKYSDLIKTIDNSKEVFECGNIYAKYDLKKTESKFINNQIDLSLDLINELDTYFKLNNPNQLKLVDFNTLIFINPKGTYQDKRGITKLDWLLQFHSKVYIMSERNNVNGYIDFLQLIHSLYDIKSHKFDSWYEMFCNCYVHQLEKNHDCVIIECIFDHLL